MYSNYAFRDMMCSNLLIFYKALIKFKKFKYFKNKFKYKFKYN